uniref:Uncharacterized protein n=1 Tax=Arundo donax TaxID=35708 RepID=A0A0A9BQK9_ARUDO
MSTIQRNPSTSLCQPCSKIQVIFTASHWVRLQALQNTSY